LVEILCCWPYVWAAFLMLITKTANKYSSRPTLAGDICMFHGINAAA